MFTRIFEAKEKNVNLAVFTGDRRLFTRVFYESSQSRPNYFSLTSHTIAKLFYIPLSGQFQLLTPFSRPVSAFESFYWI